MQKNNLSLILVTAFLDLLGFWIFLPLFPELIAYFWYPGSWTAYSQWIYAFWMFIGGLIFGRLSDLYGRKNILLITSIGNLFGYILLYLSIHNFSNIQHSIYGFMLSAGFLMYIFSRFIAWLWGAGFSVIQAYISDISTPENKTKNMGLIGAMFWLGFLVWPMIGGMLSVFGISTAVLGCIIIILINIVFIWLFLKEPEKHVHIDDAVDIIHSSFRFSRKVVLLLSLSFFAFIAFSTIQAGSNQYYADMFHFNSTTIGYVMGIVGTTSIIYQWFLIKYIRAHLNEQRMIQFSLIILSVAFFLFAINPYAYLVFCIVPLFSIGMGSFNPSLSSLLASNAQRKDIWKIMGYNTAVTSIAGIIGPFIIGSLYLYNIHFPFWFSLAICIILAICSIFAFDRK